MSLQAIVRHIQTLREKFTAELLVKLKQVSYGKCTLILFYFLLQL